MEQEVITPDLRMQIESMCGYLQDGAIARYLGCTESMVARVRERLPRPRGRPPRQLEVIANGYNVSDAGIVAGDQSRRLEFQLGCDALLRRQLETGQHNLTADQFYAICEAKGWMGTARKSAA